MVSGLFYTIWQQQASSKHWATADISNTPPEFLAARLERHFSPSTIKVTLSAIRKQVR